MGRRVKRQSQQQEPAAGSREAVTKAATAGHRHRMAPQDRERLILDNAFRFFAERGLAGETRELARRLGVTQSLIYRYFPSKDVLIERVYEKWFAEYWNPAWADWIGERRVSLEERLLAFYRDYVRLLPQLRMGQAVRFLRSRRAAASRPLRRRATAKRFFRASPASCATITACPALDEIPLTEFEHDLIWALHATQFYIGQRRWLFGLSTPRDVQRGHGDARARLRHQRAGADQSASRQPQNQAAGQRLTMAEGLWLRWAAFLRDAESTGAGARAELARAGGRMRRAAPHAR